MCRPRSPLALAVYLVLALSVRAASADDGTWTILNPSPGISPNPNQHVAVFVPARNQMIAFGGNLGSDTWLLDLTAMSWTKLSIASPPSGRLAPCAIYDPVRDQMVVFGGYNGNYLNEVWTLALSGTPTWTLVTPSSASPPGRDFANAIYDPVRGRMIIFGGFSGATYNDVWALDLASMTWSQLTPSGTPPTPGYGGCAIYDPVGDQMVTSFGAIAGTWELSLADPPAWTQLHPSGAVPTNRQFASAVYDADAQRVVIYGGKLSTTSYADTYELTLGNAPNWRLLSPAGPGAPVRWEHTAVVDPALHGMLVLGGNGTSDLRSLTWPPGVPPATVYSVVPSSAHEGDTVTLNGGGLSVVTAVLFNNNLSAPIVSNTGAVLTVTVPFGATNGPISLITPSGIVNVPGTFTILYTPVIYSFTPTQGPAGTDVTITGRLLSGVTQVSFGGGPAASFSITSDAELHATVNGLAVTGAITLTNSFGTTSSASRFSVVHPAPIITSIDPTSGHVGTPVTIFGQYLTPVTQVTFTGDNTAVFTIISDTEMQTTVTANAQTGAITVTSPYGTTKSESFQVIRNVPIISSVQPTSARRGDAVTITGQYFSTATRVSFGGAGSANFTIISDGLITATLDHAAVAGPISITNQDGVGTSAFSYDVLLFPPVITSATPSAAKVGALVVIVGARFTGATQVSFGGTGSASFQIVSDTEIDATVDAAALTGPITIVNSDGTAISGFTFTLLPPQGAPTIVAVRDVPNDQGGKVILEWLASDFDIGNGFTITDYRVWRRAPLSMGMATRSNTLTSFPAGFWEPIGDVPAIRFPGYAFTAPTLQDSLPDSNVLTSFMVEALTNNPSTYYFSDPDSGYSVDNLAPPYPASLVAIYTASSARLTWAASTAPDLAAYRIYRGASEDFAPDSAHFLAATTDTTFADAAHDQVYKLIAVDKHGGQSKLAVVSPARPAAALIRTLSPVTTPELIQLTWAADDQPLLPAVVYRRSGGSEWSRLADVRASANGLLSYDDRAVEVGRSYDYRLGVTDAGVEVQLGEISASATSPRLAIVGIRPNPAVGGACTVDLELLSDRPARLELMDISGRRVQQQDLAVPAPGARSVPFAPRQALPAGMYFLRVQQADRSGTMRLVVLD